MKSNLIIFSFVITTIIAAFSSCKKCETCVGYHYINGVLGAEDPHVQSIKLCDKTDIKAYESMVGFTDPYAGQDTVKFICN